MNNFNNQKQKIIDFIVNGLINSNSDQERAVMAVKFDQMMEQLKPNYPTCATCKYSKPVYRLFRTDDNEYSKLLDSYRCIKVRHLKDNDSIGVDLPLKNWGCNKHSSLEVKDE